MVKKAAELVIRYRVAFLLLSMIIVCSSAVGIMHLKFNGDVSVLLDKNSDQYEEFLEIKKDFGDDSSIFAIYSTPREDIFNEKDIRLIHDLTEKFREIPNVIDVISISNISRFSVSDDGIDAKPLFLSASNSSELERVEAKKYFGEVSLMSDHLISEDGKTTIILVAFQPLSKNDISETKNLVDQSLVATPLAKEIRESFLRQNPDVIFHLTGMIIEVATFINAPQEQLFTLAPLALVCSLIIIWIIFRSLPVIILMGCLIISVFMFTVGLIGWQGIELNIFSSLAPVVVIIITLADSVHLLVNCIEKKRGLPYAEEASLEAMIYSIEINFIPMLLTSVTTAIGFLSLHFTGTEAFIDFATVTAIGVIFAFVFTITILPALVLVVDIPDASPEKLFIGMMNKLSVLVLRYPIQILLLFSLIIGFSITSIGKLSFNDNYIKYFDEDSEFRRAVEFASKNLKGAYFLEFSFDSGEPSGITKPEFLAKVMDFTAWLNEQPDVVSVVSFADVISEIHRNFERSVGEDIEIDQDLNEEYLSLLEFSDALGVLYEQLYNKDQSKLRVLVNISVIENDELFALTQRSNEWIRENFPGQDTIGTSVPLLAAMQGHTVIKGMLSGSIYIYIMITVCMIIGLKSFSWGAISIIPNLFPALVLFGFWALFIGEVNQTAAIIFAMTLGLIVDDTIHFMSKYIKLKRSGVSAKDAIPIIFNIAGVAITTTTFIIMAGFSVLTFSNLGIAKTTGYMVAIIAFIALIIDLIMLPAILVLFDRISFLKIGDQVGK